MCGEQFPRIWLAAVLAVVALALTGCPRPTWTRVFGGADEDQFYGVAAANDGGFLLAGRTWSYGAGEADMYVVKLKAGGGTDWAKTYGTAGTETAFSVAAANTGGYLLTGCTHPASEPGCDMYAVKIDATGTVEWSNTYGGDECDEAFSVIATSNGGYLLSGWSYAPHHRMFVVHTNGAGVQQWSSALGGSTHSAAHCAVEASDGGYLIAGETVSADAGGLDFLAVKIDDLGEAQWSMTFGDPGNDVCYGVVATDDGGYLLAGESNPPTPPVFAEVYLAKINSTGVLQWSKTFGSSGGQQYGARSIIATSDGGYLVAGRGAGNFYALKLDASGNGQWANQFGGYQGEIAEDALQASDGGYVLAGSTWSYHASHLSGWDEGYVVKIDSWGHGSSDPTH